ncbi:hypothetical protein GALMADRAFT_877852 [Galerina marginata CBS 339.88]|uniref:Uncharacterized protein n=1 Tax=Galerina marginata (strain CBS 339.88) TaxID=685588 RepID=A0A067SS96_GALM3|nr:hypothetical protein GALMADRAFT_877852 [Galerina marginata CBS 339.88]
MLDPAIAQRVPNSHNVLSILLPRHVRRELNTPSWHPKITPYRLIVPSTTIGLGSAKAVLTQSGSTVIPTTLEWLVGTVLFLLFFSISAYDSRETFPKSLSWLFEYDCMDLVWWLLESLSSRRRPQYCFDEKLTIVDGSVYHPPLTAYRILVCSAATSFGASKAVLGYLRLSTAVTWSDWALAVPVTTILYVLGLYEYNSSSIWSHFFVEDRSRDIRRCQYAVYSFIRPFCYRLFLSMRP